MVRLAAEAIESEPEWDEDTELLDRADNDWREEDDQDEISQSESLRYGRENRVALPSVPVMTGTHFHSLDDKGRVIIPAKLRPALTDQFWMMLDENDNVGIYNYETGLNILAHCERMMAADPDNENVAAAVERITSATDLVTVENGYRVMVSDMLQMYAGLSKEVVTVGVLNHAVLWDRDRWEENELKRQDNPDVRKTQASMLRAAASSAQPKPKPRLEVDVREEMDDHEIAATGTDRISTIGRRSNPRTGTARPSERKAASAGDGEKRSRILALSKLGR